MFSVAFLVVLLSFLSIPRFRSKIFMKSFSVEKLSWKLLKKQRTRYSGLNRSPFKKNMFRFR